MVENGAHQAGGGSGEPGAFLFSAKVGQQCLDFVRTSGGLSGIVGEPGLRQCDDPPQIWLFYNGHVYSGAASWGVHLAEATSPKIEVNEKGAEESFNFSDEPGPFRVSDGRLKYAGKDGGAVAGIDACFGRVADNSGGFDRLGLLPFGPRV